MKKITFLLLSILSFSISAQKLEKSKENLQKKNLWQEVEASNQNNSTTETNDVYEPTSFKDALLYEIVIKPFIFIAEAAVVGVLVETGFEKGSKHSYMELTPNPYFDTLRGDYAYESNSYKPIRFDISNQFLYHTYNLYGNNLNVKFRFLQRASVEYNQLYLLETVRGNTTQFFMHDITANYYRVRTKSFSLHYGLGASYVHSGVNRAYFTYKAGMQYFFKIPLSIEVNHRGTPLVDNGIFQTNIDVNVHKNNYSLKAGIHFYDIGNINYQMFALGAKVYL